MELWYTAMIVLHVVIALAIIGLVLLQHGKGADMGSGFGGGASASLFGATGSANFLSRTTAVLATVFFILSLALAYFASNRPKSESGILDAVKTEKPASDVPQLPQKPGAEAPKPAAEEAKPAAQAAKPAAEAAKPATDAAKPGADAPKPASGEPAKAKDVPN
jgi:preprotein translocase subunit SecG